MGWNLVGNPFGATIDWGTSSGWTKTNLDASFYVWNASAGSYQSHNGMSGTLPNSLIAPWQGFWVQATAVGPVLEITDEVQSGGGVFQKENPVPQIKFELEQSPLGRVGSGEAGSGVGSTGLSSRAVLMFSEQAAPGKDRLDAWKLKSLSQNYLSLYTTDTQRHALDINALPIELESQLEINLGFKGSNIGGKYILSWNPSRILSGSDSWTEG